MIAKILPKGGRTFSGVFQYNEKNASQLLDVVNFPLADSLALRKHFEFHASLGRVGDPVFHASLAFAHGEQLSDNELKEIAREYMEGMGYGDQAYAVYLHFDKEHQHIHIISSRVDEGTHRKIDDSMERRRSQRISSQIEKERPHLQQVERTKREWKAKKEGLVAEVNAMVEEALQQHPHTLQAFISMLDSKKLQVEVMKKEGRSRGVIFLPIREDGGRERGIPSSALSCFAEVSLLQQLHTNKKARKAAQTKIRKEVTSALKKATSLAELQRMLNSKGILLHTHANTRGIYGVSFGYKGITLKGSEVGKDFTWEKIKAQLDENKAKEEKIQVGQEQQAGQYFLQGSGGGKLKSDDDDDDDDEEEDVAEQKSKKGRKI